ncbi:MAG: heme ABC exporter ATP-binding protein CcmA [Acidimicrobiales bacterium]
MPAPTVRLRGAVALLGSFPALAGVDLEIAPGELAVIRGANGAGKTTLLKVCAGLVPLAAGEASVLECDLTADRREIRKRIGFLGHNDHLYGDLTGEENLRFLVRAAGGSARDVVPALERVGIGGRAATTRVSSLSAGQRRRTALAALIARRPGLWLLDEPHVALDPNGRDILDAVVSEAVAGGASILLVTHEAEVESRLLGVSGTAGVVTMAGGMVTAHARRLREAPPPREECAGVA